MYFGFSHYMLSILRYGQIDELRIIGRSSSSWNAEAQILYFMNTFNNTINIYDPLTEERGMVRRGEA